LWQRQESCSICFSKNLFRSTLYQFRAHGTKISNEIEGISKDENYVVDIKKLNANIYIYIGFIIKADPNFWKPDEIKFRLFSDDTYEYYMLDRNVQKGKYTIDNGAFFS
jgi:hypothetical protein